MSHEYNPLQSYPESENRLMIIDWASLSYHQLFALISKQKKFAHFVMDSTEQELFAWRTNMISKLLKYIYLFNPKDLLFAFEGKNVWRNEFCEEYYKENCVVYYDNSNYYVRYDNFLYKVFKDSNGETNFKKCDIIKDTNYLSKKHKKLGDMPKRIQELLWNSILPKYKGHRAKSHWPFLVNKDKWKEYKQEFAHKISGIFKSYIIELDEAEGDDVIYVASHYLGKKYDSIILISGDRDMNQLLDIEKLEIYDHKKDNIVKCDNPKDFLEIKVLSGDATDNINGMALPERKTQLGEIGATKLYESAGNCFEEAKSQGWDNQYMRNKRLIDLSNIPTHIQRKLCEKIDEYVPKMGTASDVYNLGITEKITDEIKKFKTMGYYILNSSGNNKLVKPKPSDSNLELQPATTQRKFESISSAVDDPLEDDIF